MFFGNALAHDALIDVLVAHGPSLYVVDCLGRVP